jgi:NitT/TauT family transport system substrate-binding protein
VSAGVRRLVSLGLVLVLAGGCVSINNPHAATPTPDLPFESFAPGQTPDQVGGGGGGSTDQPQPGDTSGTQGPGPGDTSQPGSTADESVPASIVIPAEVTVQLNDAASGRAGGFFAATDQSFYDYVAVDAVVNPEEEGHDPLAQASAPDGPEFFFGSELDVLVGRDRGSDLVNIAQVFQRSGVEIVSLKSNGINQLSDLKGKKLTVLANGDDADATIAVKSVGLDPKKRDVRFDHEAFDPTLIGAGATDAMEVRYEDEYAQILEQDDPNSGNQYQPSDLSVIDISGGTAPLLQDGIYARASWLAQPGNVDVAARFVKAVLLGYVYCRDHLDDCAQSAEDAGALLPTQHERWVMNETNALIWPSPQGFGALDQAAWTATAQAALNAGLIRAMPDASAFRTDIVKQAEAGLSDVDFVGTGFQKQTVQITEGGADPSSQP